MYRGVYAVRSAYLYELSGCAPNREKNRIRVVLTNCHTPPEYHGIKAREFELLIGPLINRLKTGMEKAHIPYPRVCVLILNIRQVTDLFLIVHERLLNVSMPITILDFDESASVGHASPLSSTSTSALSVTPKQGHNPQNISTPRISSTSKIPSIPEPKRHTVKHSFGPSGTLPLHPRSDRSRSSLILNNEFLSALPPPPVPNKSSEHRLPVSRSVGFQNQPRASIPVGEIGHPYQEKDAVINALRERLVEVEKARDEARRIVTEVRNR